MINVVVVSKAAQKDLKSVPQHIAKKLQDWTASVASIGLEETRKQPGYHDEPLHGDLAGLRSIRLNNAYRAYYKISLDIIEFVEVTGVDKHLYR